MLATCTGRKVIVGQFLNPNPDKLEPKNVLTRSREAAKKTKPALVILRVLRGFA